MVFGMNSSIRHEAIEDCKTALSYDGGRGTFTALNQHIERWTDSTFIMGDLDYYYHTVICEIKSKLFTDECLLK